MKGQGTASQPRKGRPRATDNVDIVSLLVTSFHNGLNVREACLQSGISHEAYYSRLRFDERFADTMARAQMQSMLNAKTTIVNAIGNGDVSAAKWWLERKARDEFGRDTIPEAEPETKQLTDEEMATVIDDYKKLAAIDYKQQQMASIQKSNLPEAEKYGRYNELYALSENDILLKIARELDRQLESRAVTAVV